MCALVERSCDPNCEAAGWNWGSPIHWAVQRQFARCLWDSERGCFLVFVQTGWIIGQHSMLSPENRLQFMSLAIALNPPGFDKALLQARRPKQAPRFDGNVNPASK